MLDRNLEVALTQADDTSRQRPSQLNQGSHKDTVALLPHTNLSIKAMRNSHPPKSNLNVNLDIAEDDYITYSLQTTMRDKLAKIRPF